jgi:hypothetical protein
MDLVCEVCSLAGTQLHTEALDGSCILHTLGPFLFVYSFNCSYAEGFLVVFDMRQCKITLKMSPALYRTINNQTDSNLLQRGVILH